MSQGTESTNLRVGIFLAVGIAMMAAAIFAIGERRGMFESKSTLYVYFENINGLVVGAPVRLAGLDVGTVTRIEFPQQIDREEARVTLSVQSRYMQRIRGDSLAFVDSKGLLGDKIINITLGSANQPELPDGATIPTKTSPSMEALATGIEEAIAGFARVTKTADTMISELVTEDVKGNVARISASTANLLEQIEKGDGLAHRVLYDREYAEQVGQILEETRSAVVRLRQATDRIDDTVAAIQRGDGLMHELVYGQTGKETIIDLRKAAGEIESVVREVREGKGLLHRAIYDEDDARMLAELSEAATRLNRIIGGVEAGRGTLGGLVVDPSVYEDLKTVLGNVERNVLLKALIRFTIKEGDIERPANVPTRKQSPASEQGTSQ